MTSFANIGKAILLLAFYIVAFGAVVYATPTNNDRWETFATPDDYVFNFTKSNHSDIHICFLFPARNGSFHVTKFVPLVPDRNRAFLKLFTAWAYPEGSNSPILSAPVQPDGTVSCDESEGGYPYTQYYFVEDQASESITFPKDVGYPYGTGTRAAHYAIEIVLSYTNREIVHDTVGFSMKITDELRPYNASLVVTGLEDAMMRLQPGVNGFPVRIFNPYPAPYYSPDVIGFGYLEEFFNVTSNWERFFDYLGVDSVTFIYSILHTQFIGINSTLYAYRSGYPAADYPVPINLTTVFNEYAELYETDPIDYVQPYTPNGVRVVVDRRDYTCDCPGNSNECEDNSWHKLNFQFNRGDSLGQVHYYDTRGFTSEIRGGFDGQRELANAILFHKNGKFQIPPATSNINVVVDATANFMGNTFVDPADPENFED